MKTKIFKTGLPIMAFLMAIVFAFAAEGKDVNSSRLITGEIMDGTCKPSPKDCNNVPNEICEVSIGNPVFRAGTNCTEVLFHSLN